MNGHMFVMIILAIALAAMVYVVGTPWLTPKPRRTSRGYQHHHTGRGRR